jgi:hypothetical protein
MPINTFNDSPALMPINTANPPPDNHALLWRLIVMMVKLSIFVVVSDWLVVLLLVLL